MAKSRVGPSKLLSGLLAQYPSRRAAAKAIDIDHTALKRFLKGYGMRLDTAFKIKRRFQLSLDELFVER